MVPSEDCQHKGGAFMKHLKENLCLLNGPRNTLLMSAQCDCSILGPGHNGRSVSSTYIQHNNKIHIILNYVKSYRNDKDLT